MTKFKKLTLAIILSLSFVSIHAMEVIADQVTVSDDKKTHTFMGNIKCTLNNVEEGLKIISKTSSYSQDNKEAIFEGDVVITLKNSTIKTSKVTLIISDENTTLKMAKATLTHK